MKKEKMEAHLRMLIIYNYKNMLKDQYFYLKTKLTINIKHAKINRN